MHIAFIPLRCGSKSIPLKNIKEFCGKPLVYWSLEALQNSSIIDKVFVATDCNEIKSVVNSFEFDKVQIYNREPQNSTDSASTESVMLEFISNMSFHDNDLLFLVQATSPLTQSHDFERALEIMLNKNADSLLTCTRFKRFFWNNDGLPLNYKPQYRPRRQDYDGLLMENGAFYINSILNIKKYNNRLSGKIAIHEMEEFTSIEIDEEDDWFIAERLMQKYILKNRKTQNIKLFVSDVDGTLTDAGMYYSNSGEEFKKFNTHDGKGFELLRKSNIKTGIITSENTSIVTKRAKKLKVNYLFQELEHNEKLNKVLEICQKEGLTLNQVAYVGDDINCKELLLKVGLAACPANAVDEIKSIPNIIKLSKKGGEGAVREFISQILDSK